ncbi:hypothetical protein H4R21_003351 [Coemansia helicoidea]|uniref:Uncharacterized protein n=1 Tax=Coemansia helicoidea TaxID=1286919 RepID=A0ACC1L2A6_9FUNG|nr:hypothetical protein H4R21_003351 [Coemansia helicoidea]
MAADEALVRAWEQQQAELRGRREAEDRVDFAWPADGSSAAAGLERVAGVDISYPRGSEARDRAAVALVVLAYPSLRVVHEVCIDVAIEVPYRAGFLAFREVAAYRQAFAELRRTRPELMPQVVLVDGNGTLHPRMFGSACHVGVELGIPTVGVAKNFLHIADMPAMDARAIKAAFRAGAAELELVGESGQCYGAAVAPAGGGAAVNPVFVSPGHRVSLRTAVALVRGCSRHRVPEPIRIADQRSRARAREMESLKPT